MNIIYKQYIPNIDYIIYDILYIYFDILCIHLYKKEISNPVGCLSLFYLLIILCQRLRVLSRSISLVAS